MIDQLGKTDIKYMSMNIEHPPPPPPLKKDGLYCNLKQYWFVYYSLFVLEDVVYNSDNYYYTKVILI